MADQVEQKQDKPSPGTGLKVWLNRAVTVALAVTVIVFGLLRWDQIAGGSGDNLLSGLAPSRTQTVSNGGVLNDGVRAVDGDHWKSQLTAVFAGRGAFIEYDLGRSAPIRAAYLQGDNNDEYVLTVSEDGQKYLPLWTAPRVSGPGLQPRYTDQLQGQGRYVRISARGGDRSYSLTEVALFESPPADAPPAMKVMRGLPSGETLRGAFVIFGLALTFFLFATWSGAPLSWFAICLLVPVVAGVDLYRELDLAWPVEQRDVSFVRATTAALAALALLREVLLPRRFPASRIAAWGTLGLAAAGAFLAFYNLGHPQFYDQKNQQKLYVHNYDMRVYYPVAKYFNELRFDGLYMGSVAAFVDDDPSTTLASLRRTELRDLRTHRMRRVAEVEKEIAAIPDRFSPERWAEFKDDMRYFRETMGRRDYLGSMKDHGGNATPVWLAIAYLIFGATNASNTTLMFGALLDPLLLLFMFAMVGRTFGWRTMAVSMVVFGANDFYMFGSNWGGATLRHDWMAYLGLGICALKARWWAVGGALLALSASIRAFPACTLIGVLGPALWWGIDHFRRERRLPGVRTILREQQPLLRLYVGVAIGSLVLFLFSSLLFSFDAWTEWLAKVRLLDRDPHVNHISWRALLAGSDHNQLRILSARMPVFVSGIVVAVGAVLAAGRGMRLHHGALLGLLLIPVIFNPANYYIHFVFALPMLASEVRRRDAAEGQRSSMSLTDAHIWWPLLLMCVGLYWTVLEKDLELHFQYATVVYFTAVIAVMAVVLRRDLMPALAGGPELAATEPSPEPALAGDAEPSPELASASEDSEPVAPESTPSPASAGEAPPTPAPAPPTDSASESTESSSQPSDPDPDPSEPPPAPPASDDIPVGSSS